MPESCNKCPLFHSFYTDMTCGANNWGIDYPYPKDFRQNWCPLKPLEVSDFDKFIEVEIESEEEK